MIKVSWSRIRLWRKCKKAHDYRYNQRLQKKRKALPLFRGTIIGETIDALVLHRQNPLTPHWNEVLGRYATDYRHLFDEEREYYGDIIGDCASIVARYEKVYQDERLEYHVGPNKLPYELPVEVELSPEVVFVGYMDKYPRDEQGRYWTLDHKTHKNIPDEDARFSDLQTVLYMWAAPLSGYPTPTGVVWDYLRTHLPTVPETLKSGELTKRKNIDTDYQTYMDAIVRNKLDPKDYKEILEPLKEEGYRNFFRRVKLPKPPQIMVDRIVLDLKITSEEILYTGEKNDSRTMNRDCKQCEFYSLCQTELRGLDSDFVRKSEYQPRESRDHEKESDNS